MIAPDMDTTPAPPATAGDFHAHARHLRALAYRMLGSRADAEDVVQDAWLRWQATDHASVLHARAFLSQVVTRLCLDRLQSARARREHYVGTWLPEPLVNEELDPGPEAATEFAQDVSMAFMLALERLSPLERAAFLLHDVFDLDFDEVADRLGRSAAACRQLASRARAHVRAGYARCEVKQEDSQRLLLAFTQALAVGDVDGLARTLAADAVFVADGGGLVSAVPRPLMGAALIAKAMVGFRKLYDLSRMTMEPAVVNGLPGWVQHDIDGTPLSAASIRMGADGLIAAIHVVRNPQKLAHLRRG